MEVRTEYAIQYPAGIAHVSDDRGSAEEWAQWLTGGRLVERTVYEGQWRDVADGDVYEVDVTPEVIRAVAESIFDTDLPATLAHQLRDMADQMQAELEGLDS